MIELTPNNPYGLSLATPVMAAAGCFGYGIEYTRLVETGQIGAIVTRTTTLMPRRVSRPPRLIETPAGVLSIGPWPNPGLNAVLNRYAPVWARWQTPVILSITGESAGEYAECAGAIEGVEGVAALELALPRDYTRAVAIMRAVRKATFLPVLVKVPLLESDAFLTLAQSLAEAGADALTLFAPPRGVYVAPESGERIEGWLCGPAIRPLVLRAFAELAPQVELPCVAGGGAAHANDVQQYLACGARAVQLGAALLANPYLAGTIGAELNANVTT